MITPPSTPPNQKPHLRELGLVAGVLRRGELELALRLRVGHDAQLLGAVAGGVPLLEQAHRRRRQRRLARPPQQRR